MSHRRTDAPGKGDKRKRVTIADLASYLCLTKGTVSRAMNDYPDISEQTRRRVRRAAETLGYRPMAHAQAIRTGRVRALGLVLEMGDPDGGRPFLTDFLAGVSQAAAERGWTLTLTTAESEAHTLRQLQLLIDENKADGFILPRARAKDARIEALRRAGIPFVLFGRTDDTEGCAWYDIESEAAMREAVVRLHELGHRRIGFVPGKSGLTYARLRLEGYCQGLADVALPFDPDLVAKPALNRMEGAEETRRLLAGPNAPTALIFAVDRAALGAYDAALAHGLTIGRDLSVIGYDGIPDGAWAEPALSTFQVDQRRAGAQLAEILINRIRGESPDNLRILEQARFQPRGSHGRLQVKQANTPTKKSTTGGNL